MYEMQEPSPGRSERLLAEASPRGGISVGSNSPIAPASWFAGAIGVPCSVRPTTGPGRPLRIRFPISRTSPELPLGWHPFSLVEKFYA